MKKERSRNIRIMLVLIALIAIGIALRWDFITHEVGTVLHNMFPPK